MNGPQHYAEAGRLLAENKRLAAELAAVTGPDAITCPLDHSCASEDDEPCGGCWCEIHDCPIHDCPTFKRVDAWIEGMRATNDRQGTKLAEANAEIARLTRESEQNRAAADRYDAVARNYAIQCDRSDALAGALRALVEHEDGPCVIDHNGHCQGHNLSKPCSVAAARRLLGLPASDQGRVTS